MKFILELLGILTFWGAAAGFGWLWGATESYKPLRERFRR